MSEETPYAGMEIAYVTALDRGLIVGWSVPTLGFGELTLIVDNETGHIAVDNECMSNKFTVAVLHRLAQDYPDMLPLGEEVQGDA